MRVFLIEKQAQLGNEADFRKRYLAIQRSQKGSSYE